MEAVQEGRVQDLRAGLRNVEPRLITKLSDVSYFETKQEEEEMQLNRQRLCTCLRKDLLEFYREVNEETEGITANSVVKDLLDQLGNLNKRLLDIKIMADSEPNIPPLPFAESDPLDGSIRSVNLPVNQFIHRIKKTLLELKDEIQDRKREEENRQKILLTE